MALPVCMLGTMAKSTHMGDLMKTEIYYVLARKRGAIGAGTWYKFLIPAPDDGDRFSAWQVYYSNKWEPLGMAMVQQPSIPSVEDMPWAPTTFALDNDGTLSAWAWPGGYPTYYLDRDNCILCPTCANKFRFDDNPSFRPCATDTHMEGEPIQCEQCNAQIDSAYGVPDNA